MMKTILHGMQKTVGAARRMKIGNRLVGEGQPCFIIAEISCNHNGKKKKALDLISAAAKAGADAVKFQTYTPDTLTLDSDKSHFRIKGTLWSGQKLHDLYGQAYTPWEWFPALKARAKKEGLVFFSSAYDETSVDFLEKLGVPCYKVASFEITHIPLLKRIGKTGKPVIISSGVGNLEDIKLAVRTLRASGTKEIAVLKCTSAYPAPYEEMNLKTIPDIGKRFGVVAGLSDHTLGISVPVAGVALGAHLVEKHFIMKRSDGGPDAPFSLEPAELKEMVESVRHAEAALGKATYQLGLSAKKHKFLSRSVFAKNDIAAGERLSSKNIGVYRPHVSGAVEPKDFEKLVGKKAKNRIEKGTPISWKLVK